MGKEPTVDTDPDCRVNVLLGSQYSQLGGGDQKDMAPTLGQGAMGPTPPIVSILVFPRQW